MSDILIRGMEMPEISEYNGISLCLFKSLGGVMRVRNNETGEIFDVCSVPPHGRLGDLDALFKQITVDEHFSVLEAMYVQSLLSDAPTIIQTSE